MTPYDYEKAIKGLEPQMHIMKNLKADSLDYAKQLQKYLEIVITVKGHAWCMDVKAERRKMAKLVVRTILNPLKSRGV
jgi:hypothetical protein